MPPATSGGSRPAWLPAWSVPAGMRTLRAVLVVPSLFALTYEGFGNLQMALFAAFGGFASLILASFGGSRRDKIIAHLGLAVTGSIALIIGTAVSGITWLAVLVTIPVAFGIFFAAVAGPNAASGATAALLGYVLPVATPGTVSMIGDRLAGWWLASVVAMAAVLLISPPAPGGRLRAAVEGSARALAAHLEASARGQATGSTAAHHEACVAAKRELMNAFESTPYRPTGLATADQGLASVVQLLEWCSALVADATEGHPDLDRAAPCDRDLLAVTASVLRQTGELMADPDTAPLPDWDEMDRQREACAAYHRSAPPDAAEVIAGQAFHAQTISIAVRAVVADALIATRRADPETIAARRREWYGAPPEGTAGGRGLRRHRRDDQARELPFRVVPEQPARLARAGRGGARGADLSGVQHGFWVVLGTLSVLRTNAASTESTALRALGGTVIGFVVGALLLLGIGTPALWAALPIALAVAAYAPGTLPFTFGQAAFTVVVVVLFNLLVPVGWEVGVLRIEDVALGCLVSLVVGVLFWPRGAAAVVGDDLADAFRAGAVYLPQAVDWALGTRHTPPDASPAAVTAGIRLDEALRGFLAEQGTKRLSKEELWRLVMATMRLRLTAYSLAGLQAPEYVRHGTQQAMAYALTALSQATADLADFYERVAILVRRPVPNQVLLPVTVPAFIGLDGHGPSPDGDGDGDGPDDSELVRIITGRYNRHLLWVHEHLQHLSSHAPSITGPAAHVAEQRRLPWWR